MTTTVHGRRRRPTTSFRHERPTRPVPSTPEPTISFDLAPQDVPTVASFAELPLSRVLVRTLSNRGVTVPFAIQASALPDAIAGRDVLGRGQTGSGKTLAYGLPMLDRTAGQQARPRQPLALVLTPTRELAQQVAAALKPYADALRLRSATVVGGLPITTQANALRRGCEIVVATPGRLADLVRRGDCRLDEVAVSVIDEADQMADIGFLPQVTELLELVPAGGQRMLFSATLDRDVDALVRRFLKDPAVHSVDLPTASVTTMAHHVLQVEPAEKQATITEIAARDGQVLMFVGTQHAADRLANHLLDQGVRATSLHGGKTQGQRNRALSEFQGGRVNVLVATNVAARGIHVDHLDLVVNVDPPEDGKHYLHRGGRTARAGESGTVVTLVLPSQRRKVTRLMADAGISAESSRVHPGHPELARLTGARPPSGNRVVLEPPTATAKLRAATRPSASVSRRPRSRPRFNNRNS